ncbi:MAG: tetraacyldisaccharide 4'-kinase [Alphaproteobacteria bacterium]|nr:tetraacyldisaccharide 4'-kinase [Alphaproteobacteria bacterium]
MKTPKHWQTKNFLALGLFLPSCLYALATWFRIKTTTPKKVKVPVVCIGNLTAGGSGKTPVSISIAKILKQLGKNPYFVSRGYGGNLSDVEVDTNLHSPIEVGDEPLLLVEEAPVIVNHKRYDGALKAVDSSADVIIMDDGFQNPALFKDLSFLVVDGNVGLGNMFPIPAGPMREFLFQGKKRAHAVIILGEDKTKVADKFADLPIFYGEVTVKQPEINNKNVVAFAGIGRPQKFYDSLISCGLNVVKSFDFPDHYFYKKSDLNKIIDEAEKLGADIYTTSKDFVKIPSVYKNKIKVLDIEIKWKNIKELEAFIKAKL